MAKDSDIACGDQFASTLLMEQAFGVETIKVVVWFMATLCT